MDICILNSGFGSRLKTYTQHMPKGMVPLDDGTTILSRQLQILRKTGTLRFIITTGCIDGMIQEYVTQHFSDLDVTCVSNIIRVGLEVLDVHTPLLPTTTVRSKQYQKTVKHERPVPKHCVQHSVAAIKINTAE